MGLETVALALGALTLGGGIATGASQLMKGGDKKPSQGQPNQDLGNLTTEEAKEGASKKAFRQGLYYTSPTGLQSGTRGKSRLMGN